MSETNRDREWTQEELRAHVAAMGLDVEPGEVIPQGVKYIAWPQPPISKAEREWALAQIARGRSKP